MGIRESSKHGNTTVDEGYRGCPSPLSVVRFVAGAYMTTDDDPIGFLDVARLYGAFARGEYTT